MASKMKKEQEESRIWALRELNAMFRPILNIGEKPRVYTVLKHVSRSGMQREISLYTAYKGEIVRLDSFFVALDPSSKCGPHGGIKINGCGMDMGFSLVYTLGCMLWGRDCGFVHGTRNGEPDRDGGYAPRHEWL